MGPKRYTTHRPSCCRFSDQVPRDHSFCCPNGFRLSAATARNHVPSSYLRLTRGLAWRSRFCTGQNLANFRAAPIYIPANLTCSVGRMSQRRCALSPKLMPALPKSITSAWTAYPQLPHRLNCSVRAFGRQAWSRNPLLPGGLGLKEQTELDSRSI